MGNSLVAPVFYDAISILHQVSFRCPRCVIITVFTEITGIGNATRRKRDSWTRYLRILSLVKPCKACKSGHRRVTHFRLSLFTLFPLVERKPAEQPKRFSRARAVWRNSTKQPTDAQIETIHRSRPARPRVINRRICRGIKAGRRKRPSRSPMHTARMYTHTRRHEARQETFLALNSLDPVRDLISSVSSASFPSSDKTNSLFDQNFRFLRIRSMMFKLKEKKLSQEAERCCRECSS